MNTTFGLCVPLTVYLKWQNLDWHSLLSEGIKQYRQSLELKTVGEITIKKDNRQRLWKNVWKKLFFHPPVFCFYMLSLFNLTAVLSVGGSESFLTESIYLEGGVATSLASLCMDLIGKTQDHRASPALPAISFNLWSPATPLCVCHAVVYCVVWSVNYSVISCADMDRVSPV